ncbi:MAG: S4 domain-containing protein [Gammaproteobacteria bacterium]|nr:S4 domain-containing protein [Gammaproteobacteria bacterium]
MEGTRIDRWLWAARFFRTRSQAKTAVDGGHVRLNGARTKPAKEVKAGDTLTIRRGFAEYTVEVTGLAERRGNAEAAALLYVETPESAQRREAEAARRKMERAGLATSGIRPTKRDRRQLAELKGGIPD